MQNAFSAKAYSATSETSPLASDAILRRNPTERDLQIEILFCGICHSDLHQVRNEWRDAMPTVYPCVPATRSSAASARSALQLLSTNPATWSRSAASSTPTTPARTARKGWSSSARTWFSPTILPTSTSAVSPMAAIPIASWSMSASFYASRRILILRAPRHCCALASPPTLPCASPRARKLAWSASAG